MLAATATAREKFGELNAAVNCAGVGIAILTYNHNRDKIHNMQDFERVIRVSLTQMYLNHLTAYSHCRIRIPIPNRTAKQMATLYYVQWSWIQIPIITTNYRNGIGFGIRIEIWICECK